MRRRGEFIRDTVYTLAMAGMFGSCHTIAGAQPLVESELALFAKMSPKFLGGLASSVIPTPDGATGTNRGHGWQNVEQQRVTDWLMPAGIVGANPPLIAKAVLIANYAFAHQTTDGDFTAVGLTPVQRASATAFFVRDIAHTLLLLRESTWFQGSSLTASLRPKVAALEPRTRAALEFLLAHQSLLREDVGGANRLIVYAGAYYLAGKLTGADAATAAGRSFLREAFAHQASDGSFLELGGFDSSYQAVSLHEAQIIYCQMPADEEMRGVLWDSIARGQAREVRALTPGGAVSTLGNTRAGAQSISARRGGASPPFDAISAGLAFSYYAAITGDPAAKKQAASVLEHYFKITG